MRNLLLSMLLLSCSFSFAQLVKQSDLVGTWHFAKMKSEGETVFDVADPKVAQTAALRKMKKQKPNATKEDEKKVLDQCQMMQDAWAKMYTTYNADGTITDASMNTVSEPNGKPQTGKYKIENGNKLVRKFEGVNNEESATVKIQNGELVFDIKEMKMELVYKK